MHVSHEFVRLRGSDVTNGIVLCRASLFFGCLRGPQKALNRREPDAQSFRACLSYDKKIFLCAFVSQGPSAFFFSIGTSARTQYILAVDRGNENTAYLYDSLSWSVLPAIKLTPSHCRQVRRVMW